jgi:hypothetical protein
VLDAASGRAGKREERAVWTGLIPPCPGGERAARVARQPTVRGGEWLQGQQPELHYCLLAINAVNERLDRRSARRKEEVRRRFHDEN